MLTYLSPAKVNLFLRVLGKRPDGYHEISSLFQAIGLFDELTFKMAPKDAFLCDDPALPKDDSNLVIKALKLFRERSGRYFPIEIELKKKIPSQAGLGGGSSNAATTLYALNQMIGAPFSEEQLSKWGSEIGSDIPFFFSTGTALCEGRGEKVKSLPPLHQYGIALHKPDFGLSTPAVYQALDLSKVSTKPPHEIVSSFYSGGNELINDLEAPAFLLKPELKSYKESLLKEHPKGVLMSGSGSSFFTLVPKEKGYPPLYRSLGEWYRKQ